MYFVEALPAFWRDNMLSILTISPATATEGKPPAKTGLIITNQGKNTLFNAVDTTGSHFKSPPV